MGCGLLSRSHDVKAWCAKDVRASACQTVRLSAMHQAGAQHVLLSRTLCSHIVVTSARIAGATAERNTPERKCVSWSPNGFAPQQGYFCPTEAETVTSLDCTHTGFQPNLNSGIESSNLRLSTAPTLVPGDHVSPAFQGAQYAHNLKPLYFLKPL
jgi:hypothetical protein